jgi:hypothetical protein
MFFFLVCGGVVFYVVFVFRMRCLMRGLVLSVVRYGTHRHGPIRQRLGVKHALLRMT